MLFGDGVRSANRFGGRLFPAGLEAAEVDTEWGRFVAHGLPYKALIDRTGETGSVLDSRLQSRTITSAPAWASSVARITEAVDFPAPPFGEATTTTGKPGRHNYRINRIIGFTLFYKVPTPPL
jgi:hypothetical protein